MPYIKRLSTLNNDFWSQLETLIVRDGDNQQAVMDTVVDILRQVRVHGDDAVLKYTRRFDRVDANTMADLEISQERLGQALAEVPREQLSALEMAAKRIKAYAERQKLSDWRYTEADGTVLGQQIVPLDKVGLYVPGGKAAYPSSVLMNAIPAKVAGVGTLIMVVPTPDSHVNELVLAAAAVAGVDRVFAVGGAQAVAALAYGTESIPRVDKIVGPGNSYVAMAKRLVFGAVGIDMIAGPSEILVVCDGETNPDWIAMDLFSQAEHDEEAQPILITPDKVYIDRVQASVDALLPTMERREIIAASLENQAAFIHVRDLQEAAQVTNFIAPEHLELSIADPDALLPHIRHAGAIFLGRHTAEALGDYCAGPNHVLPTARTARFSSPLGVYDFQKRSSLMNCSPEGAAVLGDIASVLAEGEGLTAHARSARFRIDQNKP